MSAAKGLTDIAASAARPGTGGAGHGTCSEPTCPAWPASARIRCLTTRRSSSTGPDSPSWTTTIRDAERDQDQERAGTAADERAFLTRELAAAVGLGHRDRHLGDDRERARKAVTARIKDALHRIGAHHPMLGEHLSQVDHHRQSLRVPARRPVQWSC